VAWKCKVPHCYPDIPCLRGEVERSKCEHQVAVGERKPESGGDNAQHVPWNGVAAGTADLAYVASRGRPRIVGLIGPHDAGKTTFLSLFYSLLLTRTHAAGRMLAGSFTLTGWEAIASPMRWPADGAPGFPDHTTTYSSRQPGLLHLALRETSGLLSDVLFTDAPGEWFTRWASNSESPDAEGARWVAAHSDVFLVFVDSALFNTTVKLGAARAAFYSLIERVAGVARGRPVLMVRSKSDVEILKTVHQQIVTAQQTTLPEAAWYEIAKTRAESMIELAASAIEAALAPGHFREIPDLFPRVALSDPFLCFRG
jgi:Double-GTPase 2